MKKTNQQKIQTPNAVKILKAVDDYRYLTITQVQALFGLSFMQAKNVLLHLRYGNYLERLILPKATNGIKITQVFALGRNGARYLNLNLGKERCFYLKSTDKRSTIFLEHTILINNFRLCLERLCSGRSDFKLLLWKQKKQDVMITLNEN